MARSTRTHFSSAVRALEADKTPKNEKPIFGICRGFQLLNIYLGGSLYQDILTQRKDSLTHRDPKVYDQLTHDIDVVDANPDEGGLLLCQHRLQCAFVILQHFALEALCDVAAGVATVVT